MAMHPVARLGNYKTTKNPEKKFSRFWKWWLPVLLEGLDEVVDERDQRGEEAYPFLMG